MKAQLDRFHSQRKAGMIGEASSDLNLPLKSGQQGLRAVVILGKADVDKEAARNRELIIVRILAMLVTIFDPGYILAVATRAFNAIRPAKFIQFFTRLVATGKFLNPDEIHV
jgi:hypothetical protein